MVLIFCVGNTVGDGLLKGVEIVAGCEVFALQADMLLVVVNEEYDRIGQLFLFREGAYKLVTVQKFTVYCERFDECSPLAPFAEIAVRERAQITGVGFGREDLVADVGQRVEHAAVGVIDEYKAW